MRGLLLFIVSLGLVSGCTTLSKSPEPTTWIFKINDTPVSNEEFIYNLRKNDYSKDSLFTRDGIDDYLQLYINFKLKVTEAVNLGLDTTGSFIAEFNKYKDQLTDSYLKDDSVVDALVQQAYDRMKEEVDVSHILIKVDNFSNPADTMTAYQKILQVYNKAVTGQDFNQLAVEYSDDPSVAVNQGHLGYITSLQMVYPFENAAYETPAGQISRPVKSRFGYHILKINDRRPARGKVQVSHIMLRFTHNMSRQDSLRLQNKIRVIYDSLLQYGHWDTLCEKYSEDLNTKNAHGTLRPFSAGEVVPEFSEVAFSLREPGNISEPIMSPYGWHIIRMIRKIPLSSFEELKPELTQKVQQDSRSELTTEVMLNKLKKEDQFVLNREISTALPDYADSSLLSASWTYDSTSTFSRKVLFTIMNKKYRTGDFFNFVWHNQKKNSAASPSAYMNDLLNDFISEELTAYEKAHLPDKYLEYRMLVREYREGILLFDLMDRKVWSKAVNDSSGLEKFFLEHRDDYRWNTRIRATIFKSNNMNTIDQVREMVKMPYYPLMKDPVMITSDDDAGSGQQNQVADSLYNLATRNEHYYLLVSGVQKESENGSWERFLRKQGYDGNKFIYTNDNRDHPSLLLVSTAKKDLDQAISDNSTVNLHIESGIYEKGEKEILDLLTWEPGSYDLSIEENEYLVLVEDVIPPQQKELDEIRGKVISDYQNFLDQDWIRNLRKKYDVIINKSNLEYIYHQFEAI